MKSDKGLKAQVIRDLAMKGYEDAYFLANSRRHGYLFNDAQSYPKYRGHSLKDIVTTIDKHEKLRKAAENDIRENADVDLFSDPKIPKSRLPRKKSGQPGRVRIHSGPIFNRRRHEIVKMAVKQGVDIRAAGQEFADYINLETSECPERVVALAQLSTHLREFGENVYDELYGDYRYKIEESVFGRRKHWFEGVDELLYSKDFELDCMRAEQNYESGGGY